MTAAISAVSNKQRARQPVVFAAPAPKPEPALPKAA
jgi:hypothetical protein